MRICLCPSPVLYSYYKTAEEEYTAVIVDIFRAGTTITTALMNGADGVIPISGIAEAEQYAQRGYPVGGERGTKRLPFAQFGNVPEEYTHEAIGGKTIVLSTTNGTRAVNMAAGASHVIIGAFLNLDAVARYCMEKRLPILVLASGWENRMSVEDCLFAGALAERMAEMGEEIYCEDGAAAYRGLWQAHGSHEKLTDYLSQRDHYKRLQANNLEGSVPYCTSLNITDVVPELMRRAITEEDGGSNRIFRPYGSDLRG